MLIGLAIMLFATVGEGTGIWQIILLNHRAQFSCTIN
jgi:hypothetical protein